MDPSQLRLFDLLPRPRREPVAKRAASRVEPKVEPRGRSCDLAAVAAEINQRWFGGELTAAITWGRRRPRRRRRRRPRRISMQLGSYHQEQDLVRVHPALDQPWVPRYVIESVIYHELLHAALPPVERNGRRFVHTAEFKRRERLFPKLAEAQRWIRENLGRLVATA